MSPDDFEDTNQLPRVVVETVMKSARLGSFFLFMIFSDKLVTVNTSPTCRWDQITRWNGSSQTCWDCPKCTKGRGLSPQCSSYVTIDVPIQCEDCKKGISFSDVYDISSCKPCTICGDNEITLRHCNTTHNAICGKCKPGFYRAITEDCWPCTKCCPDSTPDELEPQCLSQGLPAKLSCRLDVKTEACAKKSTPKPINKETERKYSNNGSAFGDNRAGIAHNATVIVHYHVITKDSPTIWIAIGVGTFLCLVSAVTVYVLTNCRRSRKRPLIQQEIGCDFAATDV